MSDNFLVGRLPDGGRELGDAIAGPVAEFGEDVTEIGVHIEVEPAAGFDEGGDGRDFGTGLLAAQMQPVFAAQGQRAHRPFAPVIVAFDDPVLQIDFQPAPLAQGIVAGLSQFGRPAGWPAGSPPSGLSKRP